MPKLAPLVPAMAATLPTALPSPGLFNTLWLWKPVPSWVCLGSPLDAFRFWTHLAIRIWGLPGISFQYLKGTGKRALQRETHPSHAATSSLSIMHYVFPPWGYEVLRELSCTLAGLPRCTLL